MTRDEYNAEHQRLLRALERGKLKFYRWNSDGSNEAIGAAESVADLCRRLGRKRSQFFCLGETGNTTQISILRHTPAIIFETYTGSGPAPYLPVRFWWPESDRARRALVEGA